MTRNNPVSPDMPLDERLEFYSERITESGCQIWTGALRPNGYGYLRFQSENISAHRASYTLAKGKIPENMFVCHTCDNRSCINPDHLFLGSHKDNMSDMTKKERQAKGIDHGGAKLTEEDVLIIKKRIKAGDTQPEIANDYNVLRAAISKIVTKRTWRHLNV